MLALDRVRCLISGCAITRGMEEAQGKIERVQPKSRPTDALEGFQARKRCEASESPYIPGYLDVYDLGMDPSQGGHSDDLACGPDVSSDCGKCGNDESGRISSTAPSRQNEM